MKFLFIVQGEGRGHLTQAITLEEMLLRNGHEVVEVLVGKSSSRTLPGFFNRSIHAPVKRFISPNFLPAADSKRPSLKKSVFYNLRKIPEYFRSMCYINQRIKETGAEIVINFYELLTGLTYAFFRPAVPYVCIGHQYLFLHRDFEFPEKNFVQLWMLRFFTRMTAIRASKKLALSFRTMEQDDVHRIVVVPPLIRQEVASIQPEEGNYIHGYMVNSGFSDSVEKFHICHPEIPLKFFWDKADTEEVTKVDETLRFYQIDENDIDSYFFRKAASPMSVDEVLVVKANSSSEASAYLEAAQAHLESQKNIFEGYGTDQMALLGEASVEKRGAYVWYFCGENAQELRQALLSMI